MSITAEIVALVGAHSPAHPRAEQLILSGLAPIHAAQAVTLAQKKPRCFQRGARRREG